MRKKFLLFIVLIGVFLLVGCTKIPTMQRYDYEVLSYDDIKDQKITLTFRVRSGVVSTALPDLIKKFENQYPKITVNLDAVGGTYDLIRRTTIGDINSTNAPDLLIGYPDHFAEYFSSGALVNLQKFIDDKEVGYTKSEINDFVDSYMPENQGFHPDYSNDYYGLPFNKSTEVLVYNRTFFQALYGEDEYVNKIPKTWNEVDTIGKEIISKVKAGQADNVFVESTDPKTGEKTYLKMSKYLADSLPAPQFYPFGYDSSDNAFITLVRQFGGQYTERVHVEKGYVLFNNEEAKAALTYFQNLAKERVFAIAASFNKKYNSDLVETIQIVMTVGSSAGAAYNTSGRYKYELGAAPIPYYSEDKKLVIQQGTNIAMLNQNTDAEKLAAWLFIKFMLEPENTAQFAINTGGYLPVRKSAYETEDYKEFLEDPALDQKLWSEAISVALSYPELGYKMFVDPAFNGSATIREKAGEIFAAVIVSNANVTKRIDQAYRELKPYVKKD
ncbi:MAG: extracellular solute-binding protein [Bacilli bacterium]|nr:extracellular solute-binding protein [Bacilli bacterium]MDD4076937.1 extracellular solute-binding protein [Bacilli bacterium]